MNKVTQILDGLAVFFGPSETLYLAAGMALDFINEEMPVAKDIDAAVQLKADTGAICTKKSCHFVVRNVDGRPFCYPPIRESLLPRSSATTTMWTDAGQLYIGEVAGRDRELRIHVHTLDIETLNYVRMVGRPTHPSEVRQYVGRGVCMHCEGGPPEWCFEESQPGSFCPKPIPALAGFHGYHLVRAGGLGQKVRFAITDGAETVVFDERAVIDRIHTWPNTLAIRLHDDFWLYQRYTKSSAILCIRHYGRGETVEIDLGADWEDDAVLLGGALVMRVKKRDPKAEKQATKAMRDLIRKNCLAKQGADAQIAAALLESLDVCHLRRDCAVMAADAKALAALELSSAREACAALSAIDPGGEAEPLPLYALRISVLEDAAVRAQVPWLWTDALSDWRPVLSARVAKMVD